MDTVETQAEPTPSAASVYDGFMSYSHSADELLAPRLQAGLQRFCQAVVETPRPPDLPRRGVTVGEPAPVGIDCPGHGRVGMAGAPALPSCCGFGVGEPRGGVVARALDVDRISAVEFIDDTHLMVTPVFGTDAIVITLDPDELGAVARSRLTRSFTTEECARFAITPCPTLEEITGG